MQAGPASGERAYLAVAAVVGVTAGGRVRPGRDHRPCSRAGQERAKNLLWARRRSSRTGRCPPGPGGGAGGAVAPVGGRAVHPVRAGPVAGGTADAAHEPAVHRPACRAAAVSRGSAAAPGACQAALQPGADQRLPGAGGRPARHRAADARGGPGLPGVQARG